MAQFQLPLTAEGSVTAPSGSFTFIEPSAQTQTFLDVGGASVLKIPEFGFAFADGVNPLRFMTRNGIYDCGGIAPSAAPTVAAAGGAKATAVGTYTGQPSNNDTITITRPGQTTIMVWKTAFVTDGTEVRPQILIDGGGSQDTSYTNLYKFCTRTGTQGTEYYEYLVSIGFPESTFQSGYIEASAIDTTANTITFRATTAGTGGNSYGSTESTGNFTFAGTTFSGGTDGSGTAPSAGTRRFFYTWYRSVDGAETGPSPTASVTTTGNYNVTVTVTASADTTFDYVRIYATTDTGVEFYLGGTVARATSSLTYSVSDTALVEALPWSAVNFRSYEDGSVPRGRALALWKGRLWSLGAHLHADYTKGTVSVTAGSATVTFSVKGVTAFQRNMTFQVDSTSETYTLISVSESAGTAVLDRVYAGTTNATATYKIVDDYDACAIRASVPQLYNQWPADESPGRVDTDDPAGGTALLATKSRLYAFSKTSIAAVTGDDIESWQISKVGQNVGCEAPRLVVGIDDGSGTITGGMFLSRSGFYAVSGDEVLVCASSPKALRGTPARGIDGTVARINWACADQGYPYFDTTNRCVVFGLPLDGAIVPNYEIVFDLQNGTWATFKRGEWTAATNATLPDGSPFILTGDREGNLWHEGIGESDGAYGFEAVATLTGTPTVRSLTAGAASFPTSGDGLKGVPVAVLYADGSTIAYAKIAANTGTTLTLAEDLATAPAASDQVVVGAIVTIWRTGYATFGEEYRRKIVRSVTVRHVPTTRGEYYFSFAVDGGSFALCPVGTSTGTLSDTDGKTKHFTQWIGDSHAFQALSVKPGGRLTYRGGVFDVVLRENGTR